MAIVLFLFLLFPSAATAAATVDTYLTRTGKSESFALPPRVVHRAAQGLTRHVILPDEEQTL